MIEVFQVDAKARCNKMLRRAKRRSSAIVEGNSYGPCNRTFLVSAILYEPPVCPICYITSENRPLKKKVLCY